MTPEELCLELYERLSGRRLERAELEVPAESLLEAVAGELDAVELREVGAGRYVLKVPPVAVERFGDRVGLVLDPVACGLEDYNVYWDGRRALLHLELVMEAGGAAPTIIMEPRDGKLHVMVLTWMILHAGELERLLESRMTAAVAAALLSRAGPA